MWKRNQIKCTFFYSCILYMSEIKFSVYCFLYYVILYYPKYSENYGVSTNNTPPQPPSLSPPHYFRPSPPMEVIVSISCTPCIPLSTPHTQSPPLRPHTVVTVHCLPTITVLPLLSYSITTIFHHHYHRNCHINQ